MSDEFIDTLDASVEVYRKYQMAIHKESPEQCDKMSFFEFLVRNNLQVFFAILNILKVMYDIIIIFSYQRSSIHLKVS